MGNLFKAIGSVFSIIVFTLIILASLYISYILAIGVIIVGAVYLIYYFLTHLEAVPSS